MQEYNRTFRKTNLQISKEDLKVSTNEILLQNAKNIAADLASVIEGVSKFKDQRFILLGEKDFFYDREINAVYSRKGKVFISQNTMEVRSMVLKYGVYPEVNNLYPGSKICFSVPNYEELTQTFFGGTKAPMNSPNSSAVVVNNRGFSKLIFKNSKDLPVVLVDGKETANLSDWSSLTAAIIPISRKLAGINGKIKNFNIIIMSLLENNLMPADLSVAVAKKWQAYACLFKYLYLDSGNAIKFNVEKFLNDVFEQKYKEQNIWGNFDLKQHFDKINKGIVDAGALNKFKRELLECDYKRANISPYSEKQLTDVNMGHWELCEVPKNKGYIDINLRAEDALVARPPQLDIVQGGVCGIDFGTKSTVVACLNRDARLLRVGKGNYAKAPELSDYENPTVIELRNFEAFVKAYLERKGRPFTQWEHLTVSHQAADAIFISEDDNSSYYSIFSELKQWAIDKNRRLILRDKKGDNIELKPYLELGENDFDPIEIYAYYLGLYINNMHNGIYLHYLLSFPVNYEKKVRERLLKSFEKGLRKSLPPCLLNDEASMKRFKVYAGASEPAAYAISALQRFNLQPKKAGEKVSYGVFDFGGGTTDFDFGIEEIPADQRSKYLITQFGNGGDAYLGGENILLLLAYNLYMENIKQMRAHNIPFILPPKGKRYGGVETLVFTSAEGSQYAYLNSRRLAARLRPIWERHSNYEKEFEQGDLSVKMLDGEGKVQSVKLKVCLEHINTWIKESVESGVKNFFLAFRTASKNYKWTMPIHIFLAGNSSKSIFVKELFDKYIAEEEKMVERFGYNKLGNSKGKMGKCFELHLPLEYKDEAKNDAKGNTNTEANINYDQYYTGKTGVVFGLLRSRKGGKDVRINNANNNQDDEIKFRYLLGVSNLENCFHVLIGRELGYNKWVEFTGAWEDEFEIYYTSEPKALEDNMPISQVRRVTCYLEPDEVSDEGSVYVCKIAPDKICYVVVNNEEELNDIGKKGCTKVIHTQVLVE